MLVAVLTPETRGQEEQPPPGQSHCGLLYLRAKGRMLGGQVLGQLEYLARRGGHGWYLGEEFAAELILWVLESFHFRWEKPCG